jgi:hypothetical protein
MTTDLTLEPKQGFYLLTANTPKAASYLATRWQDGLNASGAVLLPQFFADAATLASYMVRDGFSLMWGSVTYQAGNVGADQLYDEVG